MYDTFLKLPIEKQQRIINAALRVFASNTYKKIATDDIVVLAGISKGSLFHYFKNKENLYLYLYDYATTLLLEEFYQKIDLKEPDIFKRFSNIMLIKVDLMKKHPDIFNFMVTVTYDDNELKPKIKARENKIINRNINIILEGIDQSKFRSDIDPNIAIKMIMIFFDGYARSEAERMAKTGFSEQLSNKWLEELNNYILVMKKIYYKGE